MQLSMRLSTIAGMITRGYTVADVGCDHGWLPIWLVEQGICPFAIAADIGTGPLERAAGHIRAHGLEAKIRIRQSDGLRGFEPGEARTLVVTGMGGPLMERILSDCPEVRDSFMELVAGPQSEIPHFRRYLSSIGWLISEEKLVFEDGKYYSLIRAVPGEMNTPARKEIDTSPWTLEEAFGLELLKKRDPVLLQFLKKEAGTRKRILESLKEGQSTKAEERTRRVEKELLIIQEALRYYEI